MKYITAYLMRGIQYPQMCLRRSLEAIIISPDKLGFHEYEYVVPRSRN